MGKNKINGYILVICIELRKSCDRLAESGENNSVMNMLILKHLDRDVKELVV